MSLQDLFFLSFIACTVAIVVFFIRVESLLKKIVNPYEEETSYDEPPTSYDIERIEREAIFDERINKLKKELDIPIQRSDVRHSVADELHPDVKNLPHDSIKHTSKEREECAE